MFNFTQKRGLLALAAAGFALAAALPAHAGKTLDAVKARGQVVCGVNTGLAGFSAADSQGNWSGLDVDICKAIAAAMLGDASRFDVFARLRHRPFPGGRRLRTPALVLGMAWYRLRDLLG